MSKPKFKIGQKLKLTKTFCDDYKRIFGKKKAEKCNYSNFVGTVKDIHVCEPYATLYVFYTSTEGQYIAYAETFLEPA